MDKYSIWCKYKNGDWGELGCQVITYRNNLDVAKKLVDKKRKECPDTQFKIVETTQQDIY